MADKKTDESTGERIHVLVLDSESCRLGLLNEDIATTLIAVASEDPENWDEMLAYWPRYTSRVVPEFLSSVTFKIVERKTLLDSIGKSQLWIVLDLEQKRFLSGKAVQPIGRDACFAMHTEENGDQHDLLSVHLPPWWELQEQVDVDATQKPRSTAMKKPHVDREFLFGDPMVWAIADQVLRMVSNGCVAEATKSSEPETRDPFYALTIEVHRDWLLTPREELGGLYPRQMLHGGINWIDQLAWAQRLRFENPGEGRIVAAPKECCGYKRGPMGREEIAIYFDLCRELIEAGWHWCQRNRIELSGQAEDPAPSQAATESNRETLFGFLNEVKLNWLTSPFEGGSAPVFILECSRRRVPRGAGVEIVGMDQRQSAEHIIDCDCPICIMMAEGKMGVGFCGIDGHHLELDNEFAFSMHETREAWEAEQREYAQFSAECDRKREEHDRQVKAGEIEDDEFASAWSGGVSEDPIPGDANGDLKLAFLLAEIVTEIKHASSAGELATSALSAAESSSAVLVKKLNADFAIFRVSNREELDANTKSLTNTLEQIADAYPNLLPRVADFQSQVCELVRQAVRFPPRDERWRDDDIPF